MPFIKSKSAWTFVTSSSGGVGVEFFAAEGGKIYLSDPSNQAVDFAYGAVGAGVAFGFKLPKIGKVHIPVRGGSTTVSVAPASFPNTGALYVLGGCPGSELTTSDIQGVCLFIEVTGGLIAGGFGIAMLIGASPLALAATIATNGGTADRLIASATGLLLIGGTQAAVQAGAGIVGYVGGLY